jgi:hypothetical protein
MKVYPSAAQIQANPEWVGPMLSRLFKYQEFRDDDYGRAWLQTILDNDIKAEGIRAYTPVVNLAATNSNVPANFPNGDVLDEDGEVVRRKTFAEYTHVIEVDGGYVLRMTGTTMDANRNVTNVNTAQLKVWANLGTFVDEFMTEAEVNEIRVVGEPQ